MVKVTCFRNDCRIGYYYRLLEWVQVVDMCTGCGKGYRLKWVQNVVLVAVFVMSVGVWKRYRMSIFLESVWVVQMATRCWNRQRLLGRGTDLCLGTGFMN